MLPLFDLNFLLAYNVDSFLQILGCLAALHVFLDELAVDAVDVDGAVG